jgi:hypothetical protein
MLFARMGIQRAMESKLPVHGARPTPRHITRSSWRFR